MIVSPIVAQILATMVSSSLDAAEALGFSRFGRASDVVRVGRVVSGCGGERTVLRADSAGGERTAERTDSAGGERTVLRLGSADGGLASMTVTSSSASGSGSDCPGALS